MTIQNQDTRDIINTARDLLVGKVPTPIDQCEEITRALIYKYISALDLESVEMGGNARYFTGDGEELRWDKMMAPEQTANSIQRLYTRGLEMLGSSSDIPGAFQTIYRDAYLPYNDAVVLRDFLQTIDRFDTRDTEQIGDAYEMMLQTFGAQAAAGQFRTPRHIIDFIVGIVNPQKHETILDPACGTAGFLVSAYQHAGKAGRLTAQDRATLAENTVGYDISPQMTRIATVNLYLTHRQEPKVAVYDTLTSEEKWNDHYDVILANPPFMSPKGGIRPHGRFFTNSKRSEVLFVDYIMGHLNGGGRAGVIVPEGVIFQSQRAHTQLRRLLVETALVAVISLPAGVFQPYSGVKTSILILDKTVAHRADGIALFKAENDGYDLGAQRRPIDRNDLPTVQAELSEYLRRRRAGEPLDDFTPTTGLVVAKARIADGGDYNLSGERYRENGRRDSQYEWVSLGDIILGKPQYGSGARKVNYDGEVRYVRITDITDSGELKSDDVVSPSVIEPDRFLESGDLLIARSGSVGRTYIHDDVPGIYQYAGYLIRFRINPDIAIPQYVYHVTKSEHWREWILSNSKTGTLTNINAKQYSTFHFPLPPLEVQRELVAEIEGYQRVIDDAHRLVEQTEGEIVAAIGRVWSGG